MRVAQPPASDAEPDLCALGDHAGLQRLET